MRMMEVLFNFPPSSGDVLQDILRRDFFPVDDAEQRGTTRADTHAGRKQVSR